MQLIRIPSCSVFYLREGGNYTVVLTTNQEEHTLRTTKDIRLNALKIYEKGKQFYLTPGLKND